MPFPIILLFIGSILVLSSPALAEMTIVDIALAGEVQERDPLGRLEPPVACPPSNQESQSLPVFDSAEADSLYVWNKVQVASSGVLRHTWYLKRNEEWNESAVVDLPVRASSGYRTWSSKKIVSSLHSGEWKVEMTDLTEPDKVLCTAQFQVN